MKLHLAVAATALLLPLTAHADDFLAICRAAAGA